MTWREALCQRIKDAFILKLSGAGEFKNEKEMWWTDSHYGQKSTIEFPEDSVNIVVIRHYQQGESTDWKMFEEDHLKDGNLHGICRTNFRGYWHEEEWKNGKYIGGHDD